MIIDLLDFFREPSSANLFKRANQAYNRWFRKQAEGFYFKSTVRVDATIVTFSLVQTFRDDFKARFGKEYDQPGCPEGLFVPWTNALDDAPMTIYHRIRRTGKTGKIVWNPNTLSDEVGHALVHCSKRQKQPSIPLYGD